MNLIVHFVLLTALGLVVWAWRGFGMRRVFVVLAPPLVMLLIAYNAIPHLAARMIDLDFLARVHAAPGSPVAHLTFEPEKMNEVEKTPLPLRGHVKYSGSNSIETIHPWYSETGFLVKTNWFHDEKSILYIGASLELNSSKYFRGGGWAPTKPVIIGLYIKRNGETR